MNEQVRIQYRKFTAIIIRLQPEIELIYIEYHTIQKIEGNRKNIVEKKKA